MIWYVCFKSLFILSMIDEITRDTSTLKKKKKKEALHTHTQTENLQEIICSNISTLGSHQMVKTPLNFFL